MGASQSQQPEEPTVVRIGRDEVPEEYRSVGVSGDVVQRVLSQGGSASSSNAPQDAKLRKEWEQAQRENARLREEMQRLTSLQSRTVAGDESSQLADDVEERKRIFDETVERVQKQFFSYQRENACASNEKEILECLNSNKDRVLKCANLAKGYENCVSAFRQEVLKGN